ncbi:DUF3106 domain-containing protein [Xylophilus sp. GW821-FHT01B05]
MISAPHNLSAMIAALLAAMWAVSAAAQPGTPPPANPVGGIHLSGKTAAANRTPSRAEFSSLTHGQRQALAPLAPHWGGMSDTQRRKWIAISQNFESLSEPEQIRLHVRMSEWAALSNQQRAQARLNFAETSKLAPDQKKERWEAYQALSEEERKKLASGGGAPRPAGAAAAMRPNPSPRLTHLPTPPADSKQPPPRIGVSPTQVDHNTLLPQHPAAQPAPAAPAAAP